MCTFAARASGVLLAVPLLAQGPVAEVPREWIGGVPFTSWTRMTGDWAGLRSDLELAGIEVAGGFSRPPMERTEGVARLYEIARASARDLGQAIDEGATGGGSDGNFCAALGIPTLDGLGAIGDGAHASHEHVVMSALAPRAALLARIIERILA